MKYYYNGQLIRTSKNHVYSHAVIIEKDGKYNVFGCRKTLEDAQALINSEISGCRRRIGNANEAIKAMTAGKKGYYAKEGRRTWYITFPADYTIETYEHEIEWQNDRIKHIESTWQIVPLEAR